MENLFTAKNEHIGRLGPEEAIDFFADLLHAEAQRVGMLVAAVNISRRITVPDEGVDGVVAGVERYAVITSAP